MTERTRVGSHVRANMHDDVPTIVHVNSHTGVLLLPYMHSHVNSGRTCGFTCGACGVLYLAPSDLPLCRPYLLSTDTRTGPRPRATWRARDRCSATRTRVHRTDVAVVGVHWPLHASVRSTLGEPAVMAASPVLTEGSSSALRFFFLCSSTQSLSSTLEQSTPVPG